MSDRMDRLKAKFREPAVLAALAAFEGVTDQRKCTELHQAVESLMRPEFDADEGHGYHGGCNNYLVEIWQDDEYRALNPDEGGSCDYDYMDGELVLSIHDPAGCVIEAYGDTLA